MNRLAPGIFIFIYTIAIEITRYCVGPVIQAIKPGRNLNLADRSRTPSIPGGTDHDTVWLHAASLGEARLLMFFLDILRAKHPSDRYLLTAATTSGTAFLKSCTAPDILAVAILPFDTIGLMTRLLRQCSVKRVWIIETELWPAMLWACLKAAVPVGIVNGRLEPDSFRMYHRFKPWFAPLLSAIDIVLAQNEEYAARFRALGIGAERVVVAGNLKARILVVPADPAVRAAVRAKLGIAPHETVLTAGCVHPGEAALLAVAIQEIRKRIPGCRLIVAPRHLEKTEAIATELGDAVVLTESKTVLAWTTCIIAKYGILDDLYLIADAAFIGGTFVTVGGHNLWEAARHGVPVFFGPNIETQKESAATLSGAGVGFMVPDEKALAMQVCDLLGNGATAFRTKRDNFAVEIKSQQPDISGLVP